MPYAVAFGALPGGRQPRGAASALPPVVGPVAGALLGVGAHLLNALPDLADDEATGVRGLPHRLGAGGCARWRPRCSAGRRSSSWRVPAARWGPWPAWRRAWCSPGGRGRTGRAPFVAAIGIALVDVAVLVLR